MSLPPALVARFTAHLVAVAADLPALAAAAQAGGDGPEALREAAHRLAGTAGPYGFPEVGDAARSLDEALCADREWTPAAAQAAEALAAALARVGAEG